MDRIKYSSTKPVYNKLRGKAYIVEHTYIDISHIVTVNNGIRIEFYYGYLSLLRVNKNDPYGDAMDKLREIIEQIEAWVKPNSIPDNIE